MPESPLRFAELLTQGIWRARAVENKSIQIIQDELGYALGREGGSAIEYWRKGHVPQDWRQSETLARELVKRARLDGEWVQLFLESAGHPYAARLAAEVVATTHGQAEQAGDTHAAMDAEDGRRAPSPPLPLLPLNPIPEPAPLPSGSCMPLSRNPHFVGRAEDLRALARALNSSRGVAVSPAPVGRASSVTTGLGGIGKTQLVCEFVHRYGQYFPGGVFWLSFENGESVAGQIAACGDSGGMALRPDFYTLPQTEQVRHVQAAWQEPVPRLLVFDNCEDPALLVRWRPTTGGCAVLLTSRRGEWEPALDLNVHVLDVLPRAESLTLLRHHLLQAHELPQAHKLSQADEQVLNEIAHTLGDLPLALHLAGSYLHRYRRVVTPAIYLAQLRAHLGLGHPSLVGAGISPTGHSQHVARTFALSYERLDEAEATDALAVRVLRHMAHFAPGEPVWRAGLLRSLGLESENLEHALAAESAFARLIELGLVQVEDDTGMRVHRLVAEFVMAAAPDMAARDAVEETICALLQETTAAGQPRTLLPGHVHIQQVVEGAVARDPLWGAECSLGLGRHFYQLGDYASAADHLRRALRLREAHLPAGHPEIATTRKHLGYVLRDLGDLAGAQTHLEAALDLHLATVGEDDAMTADTLSELGTVYMLAGRSEDAVQAFRRALAICERLAHPDPWLVAEIANNLGICLIDELGEPASARPYLEEALTLRRQHLGEEHPHTARSYHNLGYLADTLGELDESARMYRHAWGIRKRMLGKEHPDTLHVQIMLGAVLHRREQMTRAQLLLERALPVSRRTVGDHHLLTAVCCSALGKLYLTLGQTGAAVDALRGALVAREQVYRGDNVMVAQSLHELGQALRVHGEGAAARQIFERAAAMRARLLGEAHPLTQESLHQVESLMQA